MNSTFLVEYASRNMAYILNFGDGTNAPTTCEALLYFGGIDATTEATICAQYPITDLDVVRTLVKGTWYGDSDDENPAYAKVREETNFDAT